MARCSSSAANRVCGAASRIAHSPRASCGSSRTAALLRRLSHQGRCWTPSIATCLTGASSGSWTDQVAPAPFAMPSRSSSHCEGRPSMGSRSKTRRPSSARKRSEEHTSELQSLMPLSYDVFCLKKKKKKNENHLEGLVQYTIYNQKGKKEIHYNLCVTHSEIARIQHAVDTTRSDIQQHKKVKPNI